MIGIGLRRRGRLLTAVNIVPWRHPIQVDGFLEWFGAAHGVNLDSQPVLCLKHRKDGGREVGELVELRATLLGLDGVFEVHDGVLGDGLLDLVDEHQRLPISATFIPSHHDRRHDGWRAAVERRWAVVTEVAVVAQGAYPGHVRRYDR